MVKRAAKFTPEVLLEAPRRSAGVPNPSGTGILYTVSTYSFETHKKSTTFELLNTETNNITILAENKDITDFCWLNDDEFICLEAQDDDAVNLDYYRTPVPSAVPQGRYTIQTIRSSYGDLKVRKLDDESYAVIMSGEVGAETKAFRSTGRLYTGLYVRHWDRYEDRARKTLFYGKLTKKSSPRRWELSSLTNALQGTPLESPIRPFGGTDCFDISQNRIIFTAKDPLLNQALNTTVNLYMLDIESWDQKPQHSPEHIYVSDYHGAKTSPTFSPDGARAAFLAMKKNGYEADQNRIFVISDVKVLDNRLEPLHLNTSSNDIWDRSPSSLTWSSDGSTLLAIIEDQGKSKVVVIPITIVTPWLFESKGSVTSISPMDNNRFLLSGSSLVDNSIYLELAIKDRQPHPHAQAIYSNSADGRRFGLSVDQVSSIYTPVSNTQVNKSVHSWVVKPSHFDESNTYPVAYLIHGGPQGSWGDSWSTRWNPAVFAEQGYIVVAPNPTGSTGYGQLFTDSIQNNWGGDPYQDIANVFEWVGKNMPGADNDRAVALGASFGGYMVNWIQGHDLGRKLKALVCHDGIFSCGNMLSTDELYFAFHDFGGTPFYSPSASSSGNAMNDLAKFKYATYASWRKWDPSEYLDKWETPELVIHSAKDYRIDIGEGLAAFNVLQARGVDSQFLTFPDENHWVLKPENSLLWHKVVLNFINKYVGLPPYTALSVADEEFFGGLKAEQEGGRGQDMPVQGKPET